MGALLLAMDVRPRVMAEDDRRPALAAVIRLRAATAEERRMAVVHRTAEAEGRTVAAEGTVDMGGRIALDCFPA